MQRWIIASAFVLVLACGAVFYQLRIQSGPGASGDTDPRPLGVSPADVARVSLEAGPSGTVIVRDHAGIGGWLVRTTDGSTERVWPASESRLRAGLRVLQTTQWTPVGDRESSDGDYLARLMLTDANAESLLVVEFIETPLGGRARARITEPGEAPREGDLPREVFDAFVTTGLEAWTSELAVQPVPGGVGVLRVASRDGGAIEARRRAGQWGLTRPVAAPADRAAVELVLNRIGSLPADEPPVGAEFGEPMGLVQLIAERPEIGVGGVTRLNTLIQRVEIGSSADISGERVLVRVTAERSRAGSISEIAWGPRVFSVPTEQLRGVTAQVTPFLSRVPVPGGIDRVGGIEWSSGVRADRRGRSWVDAATRRAEPERRSRELERFAALLAEVPADRVGVAETESEERAGSLDVLDVTGQPIDRLSWRMIRDAEAAITALAVSRPGVEWVWTPKNDLDVSLFALLASGGPAGQSVDGPTGEPADQPDGQP